MATNVYDNRREVYVTPFTGAGIKYGFRTNVASAVSTTCGHIPVDRANPPTALAFGVNAPKPGKASKRRTSGVDSTFYDIGNVSALRAAGWSLTPPTIRRGKTSDLSHAVFVTIDGIKYAWRIPNHTYSKLAADLANLGIQEANSNDRDLVWGASYPKPPRAEKFTAGTDNSDTVSTFVDPQKIDDLPAGWRSAGKEKVLG